MRMEHISDGLLPEPVNDKVRMAREELFEAQMILGFDIYPITPDKSAAFMKGKDLVEAYLSISGIVGGGRVAPGFYITRNGSLEHSEWPDQSAAQCLDLYDFILLHGEVKHIN